MGKRRNARQAVLESLYCIEIRDNSSDFKEIYFDFSKNYELDEVGKEFGLTLLKNIIDNKKELDDQIALYTENWDFKRLAVIDKNILRMGLAELRFFPDIPVKVSIDEAIELAKIYGSADSGRFVNGVLDALSKKN